MHTELTAHSGATPEAHFFPVILLMFSGSTEGLTQVTKSFSTVIHYINTALFS